MENVSTLKLPRAASPEEVGISSRTLLDFMEDLRDSDIQMHNLMVIRHGKVCLEASWYPYSPEIPHAMYSFSKAITATAIGYCRAEGLLELDDKVMDFFPDKPPKKMTEDHQNLTIRHLLTMHSGKKFEALADKSKYEWIQNFIDTPFLNHPGEQFEYINENTFMLSAIVNRVSGQSLVDYLMPRLFEPLGIERPYWEMESNGIETGGWGAYLKIEDMAKILLCYLNGGKFEGEQVIPEGWCEEASAKQVRNDLNRGEEKSIESMSGYGYQIWRSSLPDVFRFDGMFGQYGVVMVNSDAIFVTQAAKPGHQAILRAIFRHFPDGFEDEALAENPEQLAKLKAYAADLTLEELKRDGRNRRMEYILEGKTIKVRKNSLSMLSQPVVYMMAKRSKNINNIRMQFFDDYMSFAWNENDEVNKIEVGLADEPRFSKIVLGGIPFTTRGKGTWHKDGSFEVWVRAMETVQERRMVFHFKRKRVKIITSASPHIDEITGNLLKYVEKFCSWKPFVMIGKKLLKYVGRWFLEPNLTGRIS